MTTKDVLQFPATITFQDLQMCLQMIARYCEDCKEEMGGKVKCEECPMPEMRKRLAEVRSRVAEEIKATARREVEPRG